MEDVLYLHLLQRTWFVLVRNYKYATLNVKYAGYFDK